MKSKDFNLSKKIITLEQIEKDQQLFLKAFGRKENTFVLFTEDVREFIKKENDLMNMYILGDISWNEFVDKREKLFGADLI